MSETRNTAGAPVRVALVMLGMSALLNMYSTQPILADVARWAGTDVRGAAWTVSATTVGVALVAPWAGMISDRHGRLRIILAALMAMTLLSLGGLFAWNLPALLVLRVAQGMCCPFIFAVVVAYVGEEYEPAVASRLNALYVAGTALGGFFGRMSAAVIVEYSGQWRLSFLGNAAILLATWAVVRSCLPAERSFVSRSRVKAETRGGRLHTHLRLIATVVLGATLLFQQVASFTFAVLTLAGPPFFLSTGAVGMIFVVFLVPMLSTPLSARLMHRWGQTRIFVLSQSLSALGMVVSMIPTVPTMLMGLTVSCAGMFAGQSAATAMGRKAGSAVAFGSGGLLPLRILCGRCGGCGGSSGRLSRSRMECSGGHDPGCGVLRHRAGPVGVARSASCAFARPRRVREVSSVSAGHGCAHGTLHSAKPHPQVGHRR
ncbi:MFS transporter [Corynebacterium sp. zg-331]|uniref:MFS transporter n=1 Tax=unclassified Corynebacterium TaxID=2624378 RepID=UPI00128B5DD7|nr:MULTISPECIES: MFS transporter [unclassified Corynebacterium]MBC3185174.1 MFS transporter [Corynebacterium sp. zg-331]MPV51672.1 MFS transporter [Corynebacterium sp. zg331]